MNAVYLDNNATTRVDPAAVSAMLPFFTEQFGNASSMHAFGAEVGGALHTARRQLQALLGAEFDHEIVYTAGGTESDNTAILSALETQAGRNEIVTSAVEHPAVLALCAWLEKTRGTRVHYIGVDARGRLDIDAYRRALSPRTAIASIMWANNETGTIFPVETLAAVAHEAGALFHTDAVQAVGKIPMNLRHSEIDMLSLSGHKLHAPKGIGALYVRRGVRLRPLIRGGHQERGRRAGTENVPGIIGLGVAAELARHHIDEENTRVRALRDRLEQGLLERIGNAWVTGDTENRLPNTANVAFEFIEGEAILLLMNKAGIAASSGSACTSGSLEPSHVLRAMHVPYTAAHGAIRFSFSRENTDADVDRVLDVMPGIIAKLREMSPFWDGAAAAKSGFAPTYA
ncbi:cysteine desulfurase NifS [Gluconacetobacter diazotrophicus PA1 5]|uniref:Cysteine desulfurase n=2 Tax=Gluconacetobacter diazotrophicus TaxID=33996 RepID=NIFS_GLUDA|nr:cysteine desulfurase NifS [Gluconacetobacter diazotrophicus]P57794.1 RecName: Full=Cysteine desulfurase; AltName: Full=Nitrogenase metalloclusters biosynthesis protein NifS [Gluconacetobacter diazotrophicus PA1 5]AAG27074.1 NifS [Gluconacetobacter diazotrophicus PA1 5]ACI51337.1 cysteine desulfurase NifS [Gluconacetobacter diazotrophicus PA1 5]MBB2157418.1 cysteine desulfurase NifS [Gluconacetobacter diazotrophicus]TWB09885.1 cysteine desulfurase [Gluconacetobacter diazotrophicus]CAP54391.